ncbi:hypothetical protein NMY22_g10461 [Coprinellus aureogranulatus]|nr:hypothetical protein NMY22_g10461 [Coprinellus aureogranulatus]
MRASKKMRTVDTGCGKRGTRSKRQDSQSMTMAPMTQGRKRSASNGDMVLPQVGVEMARTVLGGQQANAGTMLDRGRAERVKRVAYAYAEDSRCRRHRL